jgi:hypothetical protein
VEHVIPLYKNFGEVPNVGPKNIKKKEKTIVFEAEKSFCSSLSPY